MRAHNPCSIVIALWLVVSALPAEAQAQGVWFPALGLPEVDTHPSDFYARLRLDVAPRDAVVYVDGFVAGEVDDYDGLFQRLPLVPGHHEIVVHLNGYRALRQTLYLGPGAKHTIRDRLMPLMPGEAGEPPPAPKAPVPLPPPIVWRLGTLSLHVQPAGASVFIDGGLWRGPRVGGRLIVHLPEGPHRVRVETRGYQPFDVGVELRADETTTFNVSLVQ